MKKSKLVMLILILGLTGCFPKLGGSWAGLGKSEIAEMLKNGLRIGVQDSYFFKPYVKKQMIEYCNKNQLSESLQQCFIKMGMSCEENICRYRGYTVDTVDKPDFFHTDRLEKTIYYTIEVDLKKSWDGFDIHDELEDKEFRL